MGGLLEERPERIAHLVSVCEDAVEDVGCLCGLSRVSRDALG